ncbi:MAG: nucleotide exchange factor GrpE [Deltaproteobacteria bacterium]|nr:nucleotide exchange factor GrpE [Deltaproteobacteria bacterium]
MDNQEKIPPLPEAIIEDEILAGRRMDHPPVRPEVPEVDLVALLSELAGLKAEARAQTQSFRENRELLTRSLDLLRQELEISHDRENKAKNEARQAGRMVTENAALALIDVADRVEAALKIAENETISKRWRFWKKVSSVDRALAVGLKLTAERIQTHLDDLRVEKTVALGRPFDPSLMQAVATICRPDRPRNTVLEEVTAGYRLGEKIIRFAQVVVNQGE